MPRYNGTDEPTDQQIDAVQEAVMLLFDRAFTDANAICLAYALMKDLTSRVSPVVLMMGLQAACKDRVENNELPESPLLSANAIRGEFAWVAEKLEYMLRKRGNELTDQN